MKTLLLQIPLKKTEDVNWTKTLNNYLVSVYGSSSEYQQDLTNFNKLRLDLRGCHADSTGIRLYFKYYSQLELLDLRVPFETANRHKKLEFKWYDAFNPSESYKQHALAFEKASILFNLGALLAKLANSKYQESQRNSSTSSETDGAFKESLQLFQQAAGVYEFLRENFLHAPSKDLGQSTIKFLVRLTLGQAQEVFLLKVISGDTEQKQNSLIAKLCSSASVYYDECCSMSKNAAESKDSKFDSSGYTIVDTATDEFDDFEEDAAHLSSDYDPDSSDLPQVVASLDPYWPDSMFLKKNLYKSLSHYHFALNLENTKKYGEAIAHLTRSLKILNEIDPKFLKNFETHGGVEAYELLDFCKYQKEVIGIKLNDLEKDNDFIYHEIVPSEATLPEIKPLDSAKAVPLNNNKLFNEVSENNYNNFLKSVVPIHIHELMSYYSEQKAQFLRNELDLVDVSDEELSSALEYLKMPKALVMLKEMLQNANATSSGTSSEINPEIINIAMNIQASHQTDTTNRKMLVDLRQQIFDTVSEVDSILANQMSDTSVLKDDLMKVKKSLFDASNSDGKLLNLVNSENMALYSILGKGPDSLEFRQLFETKSPSKKSNELSLLDMDETQIANMDIGGRIKALEETLHELNLIKQKKKQLIESLKEAIHKDDISDILILNSNVKSVNEIKTVIFEEELKKFDPYGKELDNLLTRQKDVVSKLTNDWQALSSNPEVKDIQSSTQFKQQTMVLQSKKIKEFYDNNWLAYSEGLTKGVGFYKQLLGFVQTLKNRALNNSQASIEDRFRAMNVNSRAGPQVSPQSSGNRTSFSTSGPQYSLEGRQTQSSISLASDYNSYQVPLQVGNQLTGTLSAQSSGGASYNRPAPALPPKPPKEGYAQQPQQPAKPTDGLIYNQPSTYLPNMYNFFSNS